jgi:ABC-type uncharacterized transport system substrate-binding protein
MKHCQTHMWESKPMRDTVRHRVRRVSQWLLFMAVLAMPWLPQRATAHPHIWITVETEILYNADHAIVGFRHKWSFDELYTSMATENLDTNGDGKYSTEELQSFVEENISPLKEFDYFTFPTVAGKLVECEEPRDYYITYNDDVLSLYLTVPLREPIPFSKISTFSLIISDPSFYVDFAFADNNPVHLTSGPAGCQPIIKDPRPDANETARLQALGNDYFADPDVAARVAAQYAKTITIVCTPPTH